MRICAKCSRWPGFHVCCLSFKLETVGKSGSTRVHLEVSCRVLNAIFARLFDLSYLVSNLVTHTVFFCSRLAATPAVSNGRKSAITSSYKPITTHSWSELQSFMQPCMTSHNRHLPNRGSGMGCLIFRERAVLLTTKIRSRWPKWNIFPEN